MSRRKAVVLVNDNNRYVVVLYGLKKKDFQKLDQLIGNERQPIVNLVPDEESLGYEYDVPMKLETGIKLSEYLPAEVTYVYDFGDDWVDRIEVDKMMEDFDKNYPVCLEAHGNAPPEDVGGEGGYENFLDIIADQHHPDHENMLAWGRM
nr:plasmid pRiA4b ORF-3 family protein [Salicibibacter kimchii]